MVFIKTVISMFSAVVRIPFVKLKSPTVRDWTGRSEKNKQTVDFRMHQNELIFARFLIIII